jgi:hypothetical protein
MRGTGKSERAGQGSEEAGKSFHKDFLIGMNNLHKA